jgi:hypothetical protein
MKNKGIARFGYPGKWYSWLKPPPTEALPDSPEEPGNRVWQKAYPVTFFGIENIIESRSKSLLLFLTKPYNPRRLGIPDTGLQPRCRL